MNTTPQTLAALFFFKNCAVSIFISGEMRISRTLTPGPDDIVLDRNFSPSDFPSEFIGPHSDFSRFLEITSLTYASLIRKQTAIGYLLCNRLPKINPTRLRSFLCVNTDPTCRANGKSLFCEAITKYCNTVRINGRPRFRGYDFVFSEVSERTQLVCIDDLQANNLGYLFEKSTRDWVIHRKCLEPFVIEFSKSPHMLITSNLLLSKLRKDCAFRRRFTVLDFSPHFGPGNTIRDYFGHRLFDDWDEFQWHLFDNFMFHCVRLYLETLRQDLDPVHTKKQSNSL